MAKTAMQLRMAWGSKRAQRGTTMLEISLALALSAMATAAALRTQQRDQMLQEHDLQGQVLKKIQDATNGYIYENYTQHQNLTQVTRNGFTLPGGTAAGQTLQPSVGNLISLGYLTSGVSPTAIVNNGTYRIQLQRVPAGCAPATCNITGLVFLDAPVSVNGDVNGPGVGRILGAVGVDGASSMAGTSANLTALSGASMPNPVAGTPAGIVGARVGFDSTGSLQFLRVADTRDPNFQGPVTVAGATTLSSTLNVAGATTMNSTLNVAGNTTVGGTTTLNGPTTVNSSVYASGNVRSGGAIEAGANGGCARTSMGSDGMIRARNSGCVERFRVWGEFGWATTADASGLDRVVMDGGMAQLQVRNGASSNTVVLDGNTGRVGAGILNSSISATANTSCAGFAENDMVMDSAADGTLLACRSGAWRRPGAQLAAQGAGCSVPGAFGVDTAQRGLICRNGAWRLLNDRVASVVPIANFSGAGAGFVPAPSCGSGGSPDLAVSSLETGADYGGAPPRNRYSMDTAWTGGGWNLNPVLRDSNGSASQTSFTGAAYSFAWTAMTFCNYGASS